MASGRTNKLTGHIAEHLVCAELGRRGILATPFAGNVPTFDLLAADEHCRSVPLQVKAMRSENWRTDASKWMHLQYEARTKKQLYHGSINLSGSDVVHVMVALADVQAERRDRFFILTQRNSCRRPMSRATHKIWIVRVGNAQRR